MVRPKPTIIELDMDKLEDIQRRLDAKALETDDYRTINDLIGSYVYLVQTVGDKDTTIRRLRQMLFGTKSEKTSVVLDGLKKAENAAESPSIPSVAGEVAADFADGAAESQAAGAAETPAGTETRGEICAEAAAAISTDHDHEPTVREDSPAAGHGRNGADAYTAAEKIEVLHASLRPGDPCPKCEKGTVYDTKRPRVLVRLKGQAPVQAKVFRLQKLRCHLCGELFTADPPAGIGEEKYDATVGSMIALLRYGMGMPMNRNETFQDSLGIPLPDATQWEIVADQAGRAEPAFEELVRQAAQGDKVYNDDTTVKILTLMERRTQQEALTEDGPEELIDDSAELPIQAGEPAKPAAEKSPAQRKGLYTTGIVAELRGGQRAALFLSGHQHAGENLKEVLARRAKDLPPPIQMCDALSRNLPKGLPTILAHCLAHGRRKFVDVAELFPAECQHVLESLAVIYGNDAVARERELSPQERLLFHQTHSGPVMEELHAWLVRQFEERRVEPNSALGTSINYMLRHWRELTLFLRVAGAPLDNNVCERALKMAIRHRKNSLFYKTPRGAHVGDIFMSLIHTCRLCGANPFDYLTELEGHAEEMASNPSVWMPWNYRRTIAAASAATSAAP